MHGWQAEHGRMQEEAKATKAGLSLRPTRPHRTPLNWVRVCMYHAAADRISLLLYVQINYNHSETVHCSAIKLA